MPMPTPGPAPNLMGAGEASAEPQDPRR
jgi:hypothetical protein